MAAAIIVVTHDEMILDRFDHIFHLRDGRLEDDDPKRPRRTEKAAGERYALAVPTK